MRDTTSIHQFRALAALERALQDPAILEAALDRLAGPVDLTEPTRSGVEQVADPERADAAPDPLEHLAEHWLSGAYFPSLDSATITERIVEGYRAALTDARDATLPVIPIWVRSSADPTDADFRVDHVVTPTAVVVAIITPTPADGGT